MSIERYIYLLRHGQTEYGGKKRYLGHTDCGLSEEGTVQAQNVRQYFLENNIDIKNIFSSDLKRCAVTTGIIFPGRNVTFLKELREINMGDWDGQKIDYIKSRYPEDYKKRGENIADFVPPGGESFNECRLRALEIFKYIVDTASGNIAICSHAGFNRVLLCSLLNMKTEDIFKIKQDYGCINIITDYGTDITVDAVNLTAQR